jgi:hypothetical protein
MRILWEGIPGLGLQPPHHVPRQEQYVFEIQEHTRLRVRQGFSPGILPEVPTRSTYSNSSCLSALPLTKELSQEEWKVSRMGTPSPARPRCGLLPSAFCRPASSFVSILASTHWNGLEERDKVHITGLLLGVWLFQAVASDCASPTSVWLLPFLVSLADAHFGLVVSYCWVLWPMCSFSCARATISCFLISSVSFSQLDIINTSQ